MADITIDGVTYKEEELSVYLKNIIPSYYIFFII
jgi:hypothetical protein